MGVISTSGSQSGRNRPLEGDFEGQDVCQAFVESHAITFNCSKIVCMMFQTKRVKSTVIPLLTLG